MDRRIIAQLFDSIDSILCADDPVDGVSTGTAHDSNDEETKKLKSCDSKKIVVLIAATNK